MTTPTDSELKHYDAIEEARMALNERIENAIKSGLNVELTAIERGIGGQVYPKAHVRVLVFRRIEP